MAPRSASRFARSSRGTILLARARCANLALVANNDVQHILRLSFLQLEYAHFPAHFHALYKSDFTDSAAVYAQATAVFAKCVAGVGDPSCQVPNVRKRASEILSPGC